MADHEQDVGQQDGGRSERDDGEARLPRLVPGDVAGATRAIFDDFQRQRGNVPNLFRVAAHRPAIVQTLHAHMHAVMGAGEVSVLLKELLAVRVSWINGCRY